MTPQKDFIGQLEDYLDEYEGPTPLPESVRDAVHAQLPITKQIGPLSGSMRYPSMFNLPLAARYGLAAAVLLAAAVVGAAYFGGGDNVGGGGATPTAAPTPEAIAPTSTIDTSSRRLEAGTYSVELPVSVTFTVPAGWNLWAYTTAATQANLSKGPTSGELSLEIVDNVTADPCTGELLDPPVGPSVDDLVAALSNLENFGFDVSAATDVSVDGFTGKQLTMTAPTALPDGCEGLATWRTTTRQNGVGAGEINEVRIVDVDGVRLLISIAHGANGTPLSATRRAEIEGIMNSLQLGP